MVFRTMAPPSPGRLGAGELGRRLPKPRKSRRRRHRRSPEDARILRQLRERSAADWIRALKVIRTSSVRAQVAVIVIWDHLYDAQEPWKKNRGPLDDWAAQWSQETSPRPKVLAKALVKVGYPPVEAELRSRIGEE